MGKHYIAMNGSHGCLPDNADVYDTVDDAVVGLDSIFEFSKAQRKELRRDYYLELKGPEDGADYCEIVECDCKHPEQHESN